MAQGFCACLSTDNRIFNQNWSEECKKNCLDSPAWNNWRQRNYQVEILISDRDALLAGFLCSFQKELREKTSVLKSGGKKRKDLLNDVGSIQCFVYELSWLTRKELYGVHLTSSVTKSIDDLSIILFNIPKQLKLNCEMRILLPKTSLPEVGMNIAKNDGEKAIWRTSSWPKIADHNHARPLQVSFAENICSDYNYVSVVGYCLFLSNKWVLEGVRCCKPTG